YSSDVAIAISLYSAAIYYESATLTPWRLAGLGLLGAASVWFSHPSVFVLAGIGITLTFLCLPGRRWAKIASLSIAYLPWGLSFAACYFISLRHLASNNTLLGYWASYFVPSPIISVSSLEWFILTFFGIFKHPVGLEFSGLAALTFFFGCLSMFRSTRKNFFILISPVLVTLMAAVFHKYPFGERLLLFTTPVFLILIAEGTVQILSKINGGASIVAVWLIGLLSLHPVLYSSYHLLTPRMREEIKPVMNYTREHTRDEDALYVYNAAIPAFQYYAPRFGLDRLKLVLGADAKGNWENYEKDIEQLTDYRRVWVLFSHARTLTGNDEEKFFLYLLNKRAAKVDYFKSHGAAVYLYNFDGGDR
ncbi:MAG TPA: hypothetical protein VFM05_08645, partial [Candidatus Saccharimonadales bacterium]|nr:hypothetical protein [Candidatus Saccharimonadales bacterium]